MRNHMHRALLKGKKKEKKRPERSVSGGCDLYMYFRKYSNVQNTALPPQDHSLCPPPTELWIGGYHET